MSGEQVRERSGFRSTDSNAEIPYGWVELTHKSLVPGELVRRSYMGPLKGTPQTDPIIIEVDGVRQMFARAAWTVTHPVPYPRIEDFQ